MFILDEGSEDINHRITGNKIKQDFNMIHRQGQYWQIAKHRFLVSWKGIKIRFSNSVFKIYLMKLSRNWGKYYYWYDITEYFRSSRKFISISEQFSCVNINNCMPFHAPKSVLKNLNRPCLLFNVIFNSTILSQRFF